jgi:hypothetical protein
MSDFIDVLWSNHEDHYVFITASVFLIQYPGLYIIFESAFLLLLTLSFFELLPFKLACLVLEK